jgi:hypothetical protein
MNYVVAFHGGTSGRLVTNLLVCLLYGLNDVIPANDVNSSHHWQCPPMHLWECDPSIDNLLDSRVYQSLKFNTTDTYPIGIFWGHAFPDFKNKTVLITYEADDAIEIVTNIVLKNDDILIPSEFKSVYEYIITRSKYFVEFEAPRYYHPKVLAPDDALVIKYKDIYNESLPRRLAEFAGVDLSTSVVQSHRNYVNGRKHFIHKHAPWLT